MEDHDHDNQLSNVVVSPLNSTAIDDESYFNSLPDGYRFMPTDEELIVCYLRKKIANQPLHRNRIRDAEFYKQPPEKLAEEHTLHREKELYFFTSRDKKYKNGERPCRNVGDVGFWKATGRQKIVKSSATDEIVGFKKMLVFYRGSPKDNQKTNWVMLEYVAHSDEKRKPKDDNDMTLDDCVLVKLYENTKTDSETTNYDDELLEPVTSSTTSGQKRKKASKEKSENEAHIDNKKIISLHQEEPHFLPFTVNCINDNFVGSSNYAGSSFAPNQQTIEQTFNQQTIEPTFNQQTIEPNFNHFTVNDMYGRSNSTVPLRTPVLQRDHSDLPSLPESFEFHLGNFTSTSGPKSLVDSENIDPLTLLHGFNFQEISPPQANDFTKYDLLAFEPENNVAANSDQMQVGFGYSSAPMCSYGNGQNLFGNKPVSGLGMGMRQGSGSGSGSIPTQGGY